MRFQGEAPTRAISYLPVPVGSTGIRRSWPSRRREKARTLLARRPSTITFSSNRYVGDLSGQCGLSDGTRGCDRSRSEQRQRGRHPRRRRRLIQELMRTGSLSDSNSSRSLRSITSLSGLWCRGITLASRPICLSYRERPRRSQRPGARVKVSPAKRSSVPLQKRTTRSNANRPA